MYFQSRSAAAGFQGFCCDGTFSNGVATGGLKLADGGGAIGTTAWGLTALGTAEIDAGGGTIGDRAHPNAHAPQSAAPSTTE